MPSFAILRTGKLKSLGALKTASGHQTRSRETPNASPDGKVSILAGCGNPVKDAEPLLAMLPKSPRAGTVLAVEVIMSASPEFFRPEDSAAAGTYDELRTAAWAEQSMTWLKRHFGERNLVSAILHLDESTPHIHAIVIPLDFSVRKKGKTPRLNAKRWLGGRERLSEMQDSYAEAMAPLGIERGVKGSRAKHQDIRRYYGDLPRREQSAIAAEAGLAAREGATRLAIELFSQDTLKPAANGLLIYRSPSERRRYERQIAPFRALVWTTLDVMRKTIARDVAREVSALLDPEPEQDLAYRRQPMHRSR